MNEPSDAKKKSSGAPVALGMALGAGIGAAVGAATDQVAVWLPVGIAVGLALGVGMAANAKKKGAGESRRQGEGIKGHEKHIGNCKRFGVLSLALSRQVDDG